MSYTLIACTTLFSALMGLAFSVWSLLRSSGGDAAYRFARSLGAAVVSALPLLVHNKGMLLSGAILLLVIQLADGCIGLRRKQRLQTFGPFFMAALHAISLAALPIVS